MQTRLTILGAALVATLALAPAAGAATFTVHSTTPSGGVCPGAGCTLAAAITAANAVPSGDEDPTIDFSVGAAATIEPTSNLPAITRDGTFVDGCAVGRTTPSQAGEPAVPKPPASDPCVGLRAAAAGTATAGLVVKGAGGVVVQGLAITKFGRGVHLWGADRAQLRGNWFGQQIDGTTQEGNDTAVTVTDRTQDGFVVDPASANIVGGASDAADSGFPSCTASPCNIIVNSKVTGIDLAGTATATGPGDAPSAASGIDDGTQIRGNWIGVRSADGVPAAPNATAISIGNAQNALIGGDPPGWGNVIAGNTKGVDQGAGTRVVWLVGGVYGVSPDGDSTVTNGPWNARLRGGATAADGVVVDKVVFGPSDVGLDLEGPKALVTGSSFYSPDSGRFKDAAIRVGPGGDDVSIGSAADSVTSPGCVPLGNLCNQITGTATGSPGIWIDGADDARIQRNAVGSAAGFFPAPVDGPPIRFSGGAVGGRVGDDDDDPATRNVLTRTDYPAVDIRGGATRIVVGDNEGLAYNALTSPSALFTDLVPDLGPGNPGPGSPGAANNGIQAPAITQASSDGIGGTASPGATVRILQQQRKQESGDPPFPYAGYVFPTTPSSVTADDNGVWGFQFPTSSRPKPGQGLMAAQTTTADGSSEYAPLETVVTANPPLIVTLTGGPSGVIAERAATFTFRASRVVRRFECSVDAGDFVPCSSPFTLNGLDIGGHQLRVRGVDPTGVPGNIASRTWIVQLAEPPAPAPPVSAAQAVRFASIVSLPSARSCISKRSLRITVRSPKGSKVKGVVIRIAGRKVGSAKGAKTIPISLKGLRRGTFVVKVEVTLADGRVVKGSRTYRTCAKKTAKKKRARR